MTCNCCNKFTHSVTMVSHCSWCTQFWSRCVNLIDNGWSTLSMPLIVEMWRLSEPWKLHGDSRWGPAWRKLILVVYYALYSIWLTLFFPTHQPDLAANEALLLKKIQLLCLMEVSFFLFFFFFIYSTSCIFFFSYSFIKVFQEVKWKIVCRFNSYKVWTEQTDNKPRAQTLIRGCRRSVLTFSWENLQGK